MRAARYETSTWRQPAGHLRRAAVRAARRGVRRARRRALERCFNWTGLLIEADPSNAERLLRSDRRAKKVHAAVCNETGVAMFQKGGNAATGHVVLGTSASSSVASAAGPRPPNLHAVQCRSLTNLMREAGLERANFLCDAHPPSRPPSGAWAGLAALDVEGAEPTVLEQVDPRVFDVAIVEVRALSDAALDRVHQRLVGGGLRRLTHISPCMSRVYASRAIHAALGAAPVPSMRRAGRAETSHHHERLGRPRFERVRRRSADAGEARADVADGLYAMNECAVAESRSNGGVDFMLLPTLALAHRANGVPRSYVEFPPRAGPDAPSDVRLLRNCLGWTDASAASPGELGPATLRALSGGFLAATVSDDLAADCAARVDSPWRGAVQPHRRVLSAHPRPPGRVRPCRPRPAGQHALGAVSARSRRGLGAISSAMCV